MVEMTDLLSRPILRVSTAEPSPDRPVVVVAAIGTAFVALGGLLLFAGVSAAGWFAADTGSFEQAMGVGALAWLVSNGAGLTGGGISVGAVPLGFLIGIGYALYRTGRWAGATSRVDSLADIGRATLAMAGVYGAVGALTALVVGVGGAHAPPVRTIGAFVALAGLAGGLGLLRGSGRLAPLFARLPEEARAALGGGLAGALVMLAVGALVVAASLVVHFSTALTLAEGMHAGLVGGAIFAVVGAALVPNAALCAGAFVAGPGFAVGSGTQVSPGGVHVGLLPDFPLFAALPTSTEARWLPALILLPVLAGCVAGLTAVRRYPVFGLDHAALRGGLAGLVGGAGFGLVTVLATGAVGPGRLQHIGPDVLATTVVCIVAFVLGGAVAAVGHWWLGGHLPGRGRRTVREHLSRLVPFRRHPDSAPTDEAAAPGESGESGEPAEPADAELTQPVRPTADDELTQPVPRRTDSD